MPTRELTQEDVMEAWRLQSIVNGKLDDVAIASKARTKVETDTATAFEKAHGAAQQTFDKADTAAVTKRDEARNTSQKELDATQAIASEAQGVLFTYQETLKTQTGAMAQVPTISQPVGGRTNI